MKLSDRLQVIADQIAIGETMADIGTDHGFLPLYLWEKGICQKAIMADISKGALGKAYENCQKLYPNELENGVFDFRLGDGISVIDKGEVDVICIAGMGGILMTEILGDNLDKTKSFKKLILQPRKDVGILRHFLKCNGFNITYEELVREGRYICEIICAVPTGKSNHIPYSIEFEYPNSLTRTKGPSKEYLQKALNKEKYILSAMKKSKLSKSEDMNLVNDKINRITCLLKELE